MHRRISGAAGASPSAQGTGDRRISDVIGTTRRKSVANASHRAQCAARACPTTDSSTCVDLESRPRRVPR